MREVATVLPANADDALEHVRHAAAELAAVDAAMSESLAGLREAVVAARVMKVPWDSIARELGVSRQAATERFGGDVRLNLVQAWHSIESLLAGIARSRAFNGTPLALLEQLGREGIVPAVLVREARALYEARSRAVHSPQAGVTAADADRLTEVAIPLAGTLWMLQNRDGTGAD